MTIKSRMSSIVGVIGPEWLNLFELRKIAIFHLVYPRASTNINQSAPNLVKVYMTIKFRMSSILGLIELERPKLFSWIKKNCYISLCLHSSICKFQPISAKLSQNIYDHKISDEFDLGMDLIGPERLEFFALELKKILYLTLFTL